VNRRVVMVSPQIAACDIDRAPRFYRSLLEARAVALAEGSCRVCDAERKSLGVVEERVGDGWRETLRLELPHADGCPLADQSVGKVVRQLRLAGITVEAGVLDVDVPNEAAS
jgi:hypothetical protein